MLRILLVDERRRQRPPDDWWVWLGKKYQTFYSYSLDHAIGQCQSVRPDLVVIGQLGANSVSFGALLKQHSQPFIGLIEQSTNKLC